MNEKPFENIQPDLITKETIDKVKKLTEPYLGTAITDEVVKSIKLALKDTIHGDFELEVSGNNLTIIFTEGKNKVEITVKEGIAPTPGIENVQ